MFGKKKALLASVSDEQLVEAIVSRSGALGVPMLGEGRDKVTDLVANAHSEAGPLAVLALMLTRLRLNDLVGEVLVRVDGASASGVAAVIALAAAEQEAQPYTIHASSRIWLLLLVSTGVNHMVAWSARA